MSDNNVDKAQKLFAALKGNQLNTTSGDSATNLGSGLQFEGTCTTDSAFKVSEGKDGEERKIVEEAEFKAEGGITLFITLWHDAKEGELPYNFEGSKRYKLKLKNINGGWNRDLSKWQFSSNAVISAMPLTGAKRSERGSATAAA